MKVTKRTVFYGKRTCLTAEHVRYAGHSYHRVFVDRPFVKWVTHYGTMDTLPSKLLVEAFRLREREGLLS